ncbi:Uncharacterised protein [Legionella steigerwaltii]|uniref:Uncharacterized protein n=1 Tax=Legionella steigerwaltii TaxID=460 RepID=A0A378L719_9GAMM|nr:hypothetical protein [Legionella steigerwaltii]KTD80557.1 hypothetical protein Lstg_0393 [Legionella steigerwaltii]STY22603.1 Uncharacterised protein [Legionella steigerwaltii]
MSDFKSKLPDLKELASMTGKLYTDIKKSVGEIVQNYKENRAQQEEEAKQAKAEPVTETKPQKTVEENATATEPTPAEESKPDDTKQ